jgi:hypothetical protein
MRLPVQQSIWRQMPAVSQPDKLWLLMVAAPSPDNYHGVTPLPVANPGGQHRQRSKHHL